MIATCIIRLNSSPVGSHISEYGHEEALGLWYKIAISRTQPIQKKSSKKLFLISWHVGLKSISITFPNIANWLTRIADEAAWIAKIAPPSKIAFWEKKFRKYGLFTWLLIKQNKNDIESIAIYLLFFSMYFSPYSFKDGR